MASPEAGTAPRLPLAGAHGLVARHPGVSPTGRCTLRRGPRMPAEGMARLPGRELLTGGEPLPRPGPPGILAMVAGMGAVTGERPGGAATTAAILPPRLAGRPAPAPITAAPPAGGRTAAGPRMGAAGPMATCRRGRSAAAPRQSP